MAQFTIVALFTIVNISLLILTTTKSAGTARMEIPNYINSNYYNVPTHLIYTVRGNGFQSLKGFLPSYYSKMNDVTSVKINDLSCFDSALLKEGRVNILVLEMSELSLLGDNLLLANRQCHSKTYNIPFWMHNGLEVLAPSLAAKTKVLLEFE